MRFTCRECKILKDVSFAVAGRVYSNGVGMCKSCHSHRTSIDQIERKVKSTPGNYYVCNNCDRYFFKYTSTQKPIHKAWEKVTACIHCKSTDIEDVIIEEGDNGR